MWSEAQSNATGAPRAHAHTLTHGIRQETRWQDKGPGKPQQRQPLDVMLRTADHRSVITHDRESITDNKFIIEQEASVRDGFEKLAHQTNQNCGFAMKVHGLHTVSLIITPVMLHLPVIYIQFHSIVTYSNNVLSSYFYFFPI